MCTKEWKWWGSRQAPGHGTEETTLSQIAGACKGQASP